MNKIKNKNFMLLIIAFIGCDNHDKLNKNATQESLMYQKKKIINQDSLAKLKKEIKRLKEKRDNIKKKKKAIKKNLIALNLNN